MKRSRAKKKSGQGELLRPLIESERILELLRVQAQQFKYVLEDEETHRWLRDLNKFKIDAVVWAFENWRLNGHFFPVPDDIISQCEAWEPAPAGPIRYANHGEGYSENDILSLWKSFTSLREQLKRPLNDEEISTLLDILDKKRGRSPAWRKAA